MLPACARSGRKVRHARRPRSIAWTVPYCRGWGCQLGVSEAPATLRVRGRLLTCGPFLAHAECLPCAGCRAACFCSPACQQAACSTSWVHSPPVCAAYARYAAAALPEEEHSQLRFLTAALALRHTQSDDAGAYQPSRKTTR